MCLTIQCNAQSNNTAQRCSTHSINVMTYRLIKVRTHCAHLFDAEVWIRTRIMELAFHHVLITGYLSPSSQPSWGQHHMLLLKKMYMAGIGQHQSSKQGTTSRAGLCICRQGPPAAAVRQPILSRAHAHCR